LSQRERITLGILAQADGLTAIDLCRQLDVAGAEGLKPWLGRLLSLDLVRSTGRTKATRYFVDPALLRGAKVPTVTTLARIEPHRLRALVLEDLRRYPASAIGEVHRRVGAELARAQLKRVLADLVSRGELQMAGVKRAARYSLAGDG
jgi:ATP-dependent DNA helicase RecG